MLWLALLALAAPASAQTFPPLTGRVVDQAHLLTPAQTVDLNSKLEALDQQSGRQFVVATVNSLEGRTIEEYSNLLFRKWALGDKDKDDGVLLLVAPNDRKVRIETGYGARVFLTDAVSSVIVRDAVLPRFKAGDMGGGIVAGADQVIAMLRLPPEEAAKRAAQVGAQEQARAKSDGGGGFPIVPFIFIFFFVILPMLRAAGGRRYRGRSGGGGISPWVVLWGMNELSRGSRGGWGGGGGFGGGGFSGGGGGFGGGGFSGGGGSSGGGGASGGW